MHETKSPHMNHIHQHKSHNTIDLDLQSLYSISIKGITMIVCSKLFSQNSKLKNERRGSLIYTRGAHGLLKEGAPSGENGLPSGRDRVTLLHPYQQVSINIMNKGEGATSRAYGLPPQEGATSPRGAHLSNSRSSNLVGYAINQIPISLILSPLTI
jgi:hypothetical protein